MTEQFHYALDSAELATGKSKAVTIGSQVILVCNVNNEFFAVENRCSHQGADLEGGRIRNGLIACPLHGVLFDVRTGCGKGPLGRVPLRTFALRVNEGRIEVSLTAVVEPA